MEEKGKEWANPGAEKRQEKRDRTDERRRRRTVWTIFFMKRKMRD